MSASQAAFARNAFWGIEKRVEAILNYPRSKQRRQTCIYMDGGCLWFPNRAFSLSTSFFFSCITCSIERIWNRHGTNCKNESSDTRWGWVLTKKGHRISDWLSYEKWHEFDRWNAEGHVIHNIPRSSKPKYRQWQFISPSCPLLQFPSIAISFLLRLALIANHPSIQIRSVSSYYLLILG